MRPSCDHPRAADQDHAATCPECGDAARAVGRIERALADVYQHRRPRPGWRARVLAAATAPRPLPWWRQPWVRITLAAAPAAAAAVVAIVVLAQRPGAAGARLSLDVEVQPRSDVRGSGGPGALIARGGGGPGERALWVYSGPARIQRCPGDAGCTTQRGRLTARVDMRGPGRYTVVFVADATTSPSSGGLAADLAAAVAAGAELVVKTVDVQ